MRLRWLLMPVVVVTLTACPPAKPPPPPEPSGRCEVALDGLGLFSAVGRGAQARQVTEASQLIGGPFAQGQPGDYLLENDRIRVVIQRPLRTISPVPYGGAIIDADLVRGAGEPGRDAFGKLAVMYAFGRTINVSKVEVLKDGQEGGYAVIAASGADMVNDYVNVPNVIEQYLGAGVRLAVDPNVALPVTATTYYVLSPGESRVRVLTAFCNTGHETIVTQMGDLIDQGGTVDFFNPQGCTNGLGSDGCLIDPSPWFGFQGDGVAWGYRAYKFAAPSAPAPSALMSIAGMTGVLAEGENQAGVLTWMDASAPRRPGAFGMLLNQNRTFLRDFFVTRDLGELSGQLLALDSAPSSRVTVTVVDASGAPVSGARVAIATAEERRQVTLLIADAQGVAKATLAPGNYLFSTGAVGVEVPAAKAVTVPSSGTVEVGLTAGAWRTLTATVKDPFGLPLPAKVLVRCVGGACPVGPRQWRAFEGVEPLPSELMAVAFAGADGRAAVRVPPGQYEVLVSRGPEYSGWPETYPRAGAAVDLRTADAAVAAVLAQVVDTTGWMSADLHVHAVGSPDSNVPNATRAASFAAEGVDVLVSTDHDFVTDYAPIVAELGLGARLATLIGCEVSPFDFGHQQAWPITVREGPGGGAFDWAGGDGATLRLDQVYAGLRERDPGVVLQLNHPRSSKHGSLTTLKVDTATGASHADAATFRMEPHPAATAQDSHLFSNDFDALEVMNGLSPSTAVLNDWMTFLSRGWLKVATGASDTHNTWSTVGGYGRTWIRLGVDAPAQFTPNAFAGAMKARRAVASNGPFLTLTARAADLAGTASGPAVQVGDTISLTPTSQQLELTVDVQAPEWMAFDTVELFTHTTGREALNGVANSDWKPAVAKKTWAAGTLPVEAVANLNGFTARRIHVTERFLVQPAHDTWYVALVRSNSGATLYPLTWDGVGCSNGGCTAASARPQAFTNAILVDADGSGAYDRFPLNPGQGLAIPQPKPSPGMAGPRTPSPAEFEAALREMLRQDLAQP